jgi:hypothetical protein
LDLFKAKLDIFPQRSFAATKKDVLDEERDRHRLGRTGLGGRQRQQLQVRRRLRPVFYQHNADASASAVSAVSASA